MEKFTAFLNSVRPAYKVAKENGTWPIEVNGYKLNEETAEEKILIALKKVNEFKTKGEKASAEIANMSNRMRDVKKIMEDLKNQRETVLEYRENIRSGQLQTEIKGLVGVLNDGGVQMSDLEAINNTQGVDISDDVFQMSQSAEEKAMLDDFLR